VAFAVLPFVSITMAIVSRTSSDGTAWSRITWPMFPPTRREKLGIRVGESVRAGSDPLGNWKPRTAPGQGITREYVTRLELGRPSRELCV